MRLPFTQVDAFATQAFVFAKRLVDAGAAAVMPLDAWLPDDVLQAIAAENNLAETAFMIPDADGAADHQLRWFTPATEVVLCGHATLASGHVLLSADPARDRVTFRTRWSGVLSVARTDDGYELALPNWKPSPKPLEDLVAALGVSGVVETLWHEHRYGLVADDRVRARDGDGRGEPRLCARRGDRRGPGDRLRACGAGALLVRAARARPAHRLSGERARWVSRLPP